MGSTDTGINTAAIQAINEAVRYEEGGDDWEEDRFLLIDETQDRLRRDSQLFDSQATKKYRFEEASGEMVHVLSLPKNRTALATETNG